MCYGYAGRVRLNAAPEKFKLLEELTESFAQARRMPASVETQLVPSKSSGASYERGTVHVYLVVYVATEKEAVPAVNAFAADLISEFEKRSAPELSTQGEAESAPVFGTTHLVLMWAGWVIGTGIGMVAGLLFLVLAAERRRRRPPLLPAQEVKIRERGQFDY